MVTIIKYLFYALIIMAIYFIGVGFYQGTVDKNSTISEMTNHITSNAKQSLKEGYETTKDAVQNGIENMKIEGEEKLENTEDSIETKTREVIENGLK